MTRIRHSLCLLVLASLVSACGLFGIGKSNEYQVAKRQSQPALEVPPELTLPSPDDRFAIPDPKASTSYSAYTTQRAGPPAATTEAQLAASGVAPGTVLPKIEGVRMERFGDQRWVVVKVEPAVAWNYIKEFWNDAGYTLDRESPEAGIMETAWSETRAKVPQGLIRDTIDKFIPGMYSTGERNKYRTRLEKGTEPGTTEIFVSHRAMQELFTNQNQDITKWQPAPANREYEAEMLSRIMVKFGAPEPKPVITASAAPAGATKAGATKAGATPSVMDPTRNAVLENAGAGPLVVNDGFDRAWRRVGLALDRTGFTVEDRDRSKGLFFVRYIDPDVDYDAGRTKGFVEKLMFWKSPPKPGERAQYRILVSDAGGGMSQVLVQNFTGTPEATPTGKRILSLLYDQLK
jgi:outer membrane protein assembly factor BamC